MGDALGSSEPSFHKCATCFFLARICEPECLTTPLPFNIPDLSKFDWHGCKVSGPASVYELSRVPSRGLDSASPLGHQVSSSAPLPQFSDRMLRRTCGIRAYKTARRMRAWGPHRRAVDPSGGRRPDSLASAYCASATSSSIFAQNVMLL